MSRLAAIFSVLALLCAGLFAQQPSKPTFDDKPPALSLPPLKELSPPPSLSPAPKKAENPPAKPATPPAEKPVSPPPADPVMNAPQAPPPSVAAKERLAQKPAIPPLPASSASGMFNVRGADLQTRTLMLQRCEAIGAEMQNLIPDTSVDGHKAIPVTVNIRSAPDLNPNLPAVYPNITQLDWGGFDLLITVQARPDFNPNEFRTELVRLLVVERILRGHKSITPRGGILPDWLLVGIHEALDYRSRNKPSALFSAIFRTGKVFGIEEILDVKLANLDALSRAIYNTSCCALVLTLVDQPDGVLRMAKLLNALPTTEKSNRELISEWFPNLALTSSSLDKWWSLQMANLSRPSVFEPLGPAETAAALENALYFRYETADSSPAPSRRVAKTEEPAPPPEATPEEKKKMSGIIRNFFRRDKKDEPPTEEQAEAQPKPEEKAKVKEEEKPKQDDAEKPARPQRDDGPGLLGRLFFGDPKKPKDAPEEKKADSKKEETKEDKKPTKKDSAALIPQAVMHTWSPLMALVSEPLFIGQSSSNGPRFAVSIFGLGKKKTPEEVAAEKAEDERKAAEKKKVEEDKAKAKADEKAKEEADKAARDAERQKAKAEKDAARKAKDEENDKEKTKEAPAPAPAAKTPEPEPAPRPSKPRPRAISVPIDEFGRIVSRSDRKSICAATASNLALLSRRAHPLFRPIITQYIAVIGAISEGKTKDVAAALAELKTAQAAALEQAKAVQSHLDFLEASTTKNYSGQFDDYLKLPETIKKELAPRTDIIGKTLDELEARPK